MNKFSYSPLSKFYYRYANLALSFILLTYLVVLLLDVGSNTYLIFPALLNLLIVYVVNKYYIRTYRNLPFLITVDEEKIAASDFMFSKQAVEIKFSDIDGISGGVFGFNPKGLIYIHNGEQNRSINIHPSMIDADTLLKLILSRVNKELRDETVKKLKQQD
jgi:hypothetical protein